MTALLTTAALVAFAANSVLCRVALRDGSIDAATFSTIRLASGAVVLWLLGRGADGPDRTTHGSWASAAFLFLYAVPFSFAYSSLTTGTGALMLFGCVQLTMMGAGLVAGERPRALQWAGLCAALAGLVYLVLPGLSAPPAGGAALMATAGCAWGVYTLRGRGAGNPFVVTGSNFARAVPMALAVSAAAAPWFHAGAVGVACAIASGAVASAIGYVMWYAAVRGLTAIRAAVVQLAVPILAAAAGVALLGEPPTPRLAVATLLVVGGIGLALGVRERRPRAPAAAPGVRQ